MINDQPYNGSSLGTQMRDILILVHLTVANPTVLPIILVATYIYRGSGGGNFKNLRYLKSTPFKFLKHELDL